MQGNTVRQKFLAYMQARKHAVVPSAALVPDNDPTTLFTGSGMQPMLPYLLGESHPKGVRIADSQRCFRAEDIEEVGDTSHTTFFEMLGNWSFGDYFKEEQIEWIFGFLINEIGIDPERLYVTAFGGDEKNNLPKDTNAPAIWQELFAQKGISNGIAEMGSAKAGALRGIQAGERIFYYDAKENWWSRAGVPDNMPIGEPGGPDSEMFYDFDPSGATHRPEFGERCHPACDCGRFMEIGNSVFMQYLKTGENEFITLQNKNIDFGGGLERILAAANDDGDVYKTDLLWNIVTQIQTLSGQSYQGNEEAFRVIADHIRGAVFMIGDGVFPSNSEQGYFARRLLRRSVRYADSLGVPANKLQDLAESVISTYVDHYQHLSEKREEIKAAISEEEKQFRTTLQKGLKELEKMVREVGTISGHDAFVLFTTYGFPFELTVEVASESGYEMDEATRESFQEQMRLHKEKSRAGAEQKFKGGLADNSEKVVQYHTTTHLMLAAMRKILGTHVHQAGSNITGDRLRFDFTHGEKVSDEQREQIERWVNDALVTGGVVKVETMSKSAAENDPTVEGSFWDRYPDEVKVYTITGSDGTVYSRELCGGPHVEDLSEISGTFKIKKEESSSAGVRRIKAELIVA